VKNLKGRVEIAGNNHLETLRNCVGYYTCPKTPGGQRLGPLVGYTARYEGPDGKKLQFVGDTYANFAMAEPWPHVLKFFATELARLLDERLGLDNIDVACGAPIGGYSLADALGLVTESFLVVKAEKKVFELATADSREVSQPVFGRHTIEKGQRVIVVEDVCNNFSTTNLLLGRIMLLGGIPVAIASFLNRSLTVDDVYTAKRELRPDFADIPGLEGLQLPVISLVRQPIPEWRQDDPAVAADIAKGNVVWKPKDKWDDLMLAMDAATQQ